MSRTFFAIGHSTKPFEKFAEVLKAHHVTLLADIRTIPRSKHNPQYEEDNLKRELKKEGIQYRHFKDLGGLRKPKPDSINKAWENAGFRGYADYMQTEEFEKALDELWTLGEKETIAYMCAEGNPFRCHRLLLSDALVARRAEVYHISSKSPGKAHTLSAFAKHQGRKIFYPALV